MQEILHRATLLCADDDASVIIRLRAMLSDTYNIVATASDGEDALKQALQLRPDVAILDISMPRMDGMTVARYMRKAECPTKIIFLTLIQDEDYVAIARTIGNGYVLKKKLASDLVPALQSAVRGEFYCSL
ncbi:response regulator transcription factor [Terriglobus sp. RCC_193]|uniref:response regulator n=1 Tax=Terriglobus sp. RCC_193 TaxID=3239218 RepID=UPI0035245074